MSIAVIDHMHSRNTTRVKNSDWRRPSGLGINRGVTHWLPTRTGWLPHARIRETARSSICEFPANFWILSTQPATLYMLRAFIAYHVLGFYSVPHLTFFHE